MTVSGYLLRSRRRWEQLLDGPVTSRWVRGTGCFLTGLLLSAGTLGRLPQPLAAAGVLGRRKWESLAWALGAGIGYWVFFRGSVGIAWTVCALGMNFLFRLLDYGRLVPRRGALGMGVAVAFLGVGARLLSGDETPPEALLLQACLAAAAGAYWCLIFMEPDTPLSRGRWAAVLWALGGVSPHLGLLAGSFLAAGGIPQCALAGIALDLSGAAPLSVTAVLCAADLLGNVLGKPWRYALPGLTAAIFLGAAGAYDWGSLGCIALGGLMGGVLGISAPRARTPGTTGAAQVRLEQMSRLMLCLRQLLLSADTYPTDEAALADRVRRNACGSCNLQSACPDREKLNLEALRDPLGFQCRRTGRVLQELRRSQDSLRLLRAGKARQQELRRAMSRQYAFLAAYLSYMADRLPGSAAGGGGNFRLQLAVRSHSRDKADGDRCVAFRGGGCRYYVALCDGLGTGLPAARDSRETLELLRRILGAGLPPRFAMEVVNTQMILTGKSAASTVDLAEVRLDTGQVRLYKWGASESLYMDRGKVRFLGGVTPPPGISMEEAPEILPPVELGRGESLVLISDGVEPGNPERLADKWEESPGYIAAWVVKNWGSGTDDATAAVLHLLPSVH